MKHVGTFCGIGGFHLAAEWMGWENVASCEINPFGQRVLRYYWPDMFRHDDISTLTGKRIIQEIEKRYGLFDANEIVFSGGFPCQPFSTAGKRKGSNDDRHLWPETRRVMSELRPGVAVLENVPGLLSILEPTSVSEMEKKALQLFHKGHTDAEVVSIYERIQRRTIGIIIEQLEEIGYELPRTRSGEPVVLCVPAASVNAPHMRNRIWFVAYAGNSIHQKRLDDGRARSKKGRSKSEHQRQDGRHENGQRVWTESATLSSEQAPAHSHHPGSSTPGRGTDPHRPAQGEEREREPQCMAGRPSSGGDVANAIEQGLSGGYEPGNGGSPGDPPQRQELEGRFATPDWSEFPTQPPVLPGDDGLSAPVAGYTERQWYNEHIKAAGNAIVPQVALQIFKAIEAYENR